MKQIQKLGTAEADQMLPVRPGYGPVQPQPQPVHIILSEPGAADLYISVQQRLADHGEYEQSQNTCQPPRAGQGGQQPAEHCCRLAVGLNIKALQQRYQQKHADAAGQGHQE